MPPPKRNPRPEFSDEQILKADDPRPQRVTQYPSASSAARRAVKVDDAVPTSIYDTEADQEMRAQYGVPDANHTPAFLFVERGPGAGQLLELKQGAVVVGRASVADLRLQHPSISRRHAQVRRVGEQFFVKDLGSQNGSFVNKERITGEVAIKPGDSLALGNALVLLRGPLKHDEKPGVGRATRARPAEPRPSNDARPDKTRIPTAVVARPMPSATLAPVSSTANTVKMVILAGTVGFGLAAALAFGLVKAMSPATPVVAPAVVAAPSAGTVSPQEKDKLIDDALKRRMAERRPETEAPEVTAAPTPEPTPAPATPRVIRLTAPVAARPVVAAPVRAPAPAPARAAAPAEEADDSKGRAQILASYEKGDAEGSLDAAKKAGDKELTGKLSNFLQAYDAANDAMIANNSGAAMAQYQRALAIDEQLSNGWGKYGGEIRRKLSNLYTLVGLQHVTNGEDENAKKAFQSALKHDPTNERAKAQLEKLSSSSKSADDAFDQPAARKATPPAAKKAAKATSIDDAFGE